jgi:hypothetical protein
MCSMSMHYIIQNTLNTNKCTKGFFITCNTLLYVSTLLSHLQGKLSAVVTLYSWAVDCVLRTLCGPGLQAKTTESSRLQKATQYTINSSTIKCNHSVTTAESSPWRWPNRVETCRSELQVMKKPFVHLFVFNVFCILIHSLHDGPWWIFLYSQ